MKKSLLLSIVGIAFLCFGIFWLATIYKRCEVIYPTAERASTAAGISTAGTTAAKAIQKIRSPDAKEYFFVCFWILACLEVACGLGYIIAGTALWRRLPMGRIAGLTAVGLDIFFKAWTIIYFFLCAAPLAKVTKNPNVVLAYFYADSGLWARFSGWASGLMFLKWSTAIDAIVYVFFIGFLLYFLNSSDVKKEFSKG